MNAHGRSHGRVAAALDDKDIGMHTEILSGRFHHVATLMGPRERESHYQVMIANYESIFQFDHIIFIEASYTLGTSLRPPVILFFSSL